MAWLIGIPKNEGFEFDRVHAAVLERGLERAVHELMLLDERFAFELRRTNGHVKMIHRSRTVHDAYLGVGQLGSNQTGQCDIVDHAFRRARALSASANPRASLRVSGNRFAPLDRAAVTPDASTIPETPSRSAGTPVARKGP